MSWSLTERGTQTQFASSTNWTSASFTPDGDAMLLLIVYSTVAITGVSGHDGGASWVQFFSETFHGNNLEVWGCFTPTSPSAGSVTVTIPYEYVFSADLLEIQESVNGVDVSGTVANAFGTPANVEGYDLRSPQITLASFANSNNLSFVFHYVQHAGKTVTVETGFTALTGVDFNLSIFPYHKDSEENTIDGTCSPYTWNGLWGVEIKQASGGSSGLKKIGDTDLTGVGSIGGVSKGSIKKIGDESIS